MWYTYKIQVINNLLISHIELRLEDDPELAPYTHQRQIDVVVCGQGSYHGIQSVRKYIDSLLDILIQKLAEFGIIDCASAQELSFLIVKEAERYC